ncbi:MAG: magnesium/cobalt transporter CorA [Paludibacteraceae bacterium]
MKETQPKPRSTRNNLLYEQLQYTGDKHLDTQFELFVFDKSDAQHFVGDTADAIAEHIHPDKVNWLRVTGLADTAKIEQLHTRFGISVLWLQDILNTRHIAKIENQRTALLTITDVYTQADNAPIDKEHVSVLLQKGCVFSFQESRAPLFAPIADAILNNKGKVRRQSADYLYNLLLSHIFDGYLSILDRQRDRILEMENTLMEFDNTRPSGIGRDIQMVRKDYMLLRKNLLPLREQFATLSESPLITAANKIYYKDTFDHLLQVLQLIDNAKESITALVDLYLANNDLRMNHIMSRLTVLSAVFIPLTFLVGVWGMNFRYMPELEWTYGYLFAWVVMIVVAGAVIWWLWRKKWF